MPTEITRNQAAELYLSELQRQMAGMSQVDRTIKRFVDRDPLTKKMITLSMVDLIREVQNRTVLGLRRSVEYVQQLETAKGEPLYIIV